MAERIKSFADILGIVLVFLTLFTSQRQDAIRTLWRSRDTEKRDATRELLILATLTTLTVLTTLAGADLFGHAIAHLHPLAAEGSTRSLFSVIWILLLGLVVWQVALLLDAMHLRAKAR